MSIFCASISSLYFPSEISFRISFGSLLSIKTPRAWQVPITDFTDAMNVFESRLLCFDFAIEITCSIAKFPTFCFSRAPEAFSILSSFLINSDVGGDRTLIETFFVLGSMVRWTGTVMPLNSDVAVFTSEIILPILIPIGPSCCATAGPGVIFSPSTNNLISVILKCFVSKTMLFVI